jgi:hypothetical protein
LKINILLLEYDYSTFKLFPYKLKDLGYFVVNNNFTVKDLKMYLIEELKEKQNIDLEFEGLLIREHTTNRPSKVFII